MTRPQRLIVLVTVVVLAVFGGLWWTKTIAFTRTALVEFSVTPTQPDAGTTSYVFVGIQTTPEDLTKTAELLARTRDGAAEDYESDLTIAGASDIAGIAVTARARTPGAATALANDAARALSSYLNDMPTTTTNKITYRVSLLAQ
ncbi:hypothetical protein [Rhodococcus sp. IEGM 1318]|uniref:hypothetical protein n=1 Tax=Rhodococcus sp. IEGM 1318 TaxID=3082226 RepID=UPI002955B494|nr:hypothetical protein [Rhodococcus sp. IEGM 1318]MDV8006987.1 hypothetical protein [Rhodococcus sp. IEGM 1318]